MEHNLYQSGDNLMLLSSRKDFINWKQAWPKYFGSQAVKNLHKRPLLNNYCSKKPTRLST